MDVAVLSPEALRQLVREAVREELDAAKGAAATGLITTEEAGELANVTPKTIRAWVRDGRLLVEKRRGRRMFFRREAVLEARHGGGVPGRDPLIGSLLTRSS